MGAVRISDRRESASAKARRRLVSVPVVLLMAVVVTLLLPALLVIAVVVDIVRLALSRTPPIVGRLILMMEAYLIAEVVGIVTLFGAWLASGFGRDDARLQGLTFAIQQGWAGWLLGCARVIFSLRIDISGSDVAARGPYVLLIRHTSIVDNLLPALAISRPFGVRLRYVLKRELLVDPSFDIAGSRLPNHFVDRDSGDSSELDHVRAIAQWMGEEDAVLIYPEGTRATDAKRSRALERIAERDPQRAARMSKLAHSLPPRPGGTLALMEAAPEADVVVMVHAGLDGLRGVAEVLDGGLVRRQIAIRFERVPRSAIPEGGEAEWLDSLWLGIDGWVGDALAAQARGERPAGFEAGVAV